MMALPPPRNERENVIPLINVVFLLLIFFMIAGQMTQPETLGITPPDVEGTYDTAGMADKLLLDSHGTLMLGDKVIAPDDLSGLVKEDSPVTLKIDRDCKRDCFLPVLKALQEAGQQKVNLITLQAAPNA